MNNPFETCPGDSYSPVCAGGCKPRAAYCEYKGRFSGGTVRGTSVDDTPLPEDIRLRVQAGEPIKTTFLVNPEPETWTRHGTGVTGNKTRYVPPTKD